MDFPQFSEFEYHARCSATLLLANNALARKVPRSYNPCMASFLANVVEILRGQGSLEVFALVTAAQKLKPVKKADDHLISEIIECAKRGEGGLHVAEYPSYKLKGSIPEVLPRGRYIRCAVEALSESPRPLGLKELAARYAQKYNPHVSAPEFWMYAMLRSDGKSLVTQAGELRVGLEPDAGEPAVTVHAASGKSGESRKVEPLQEKIYEDNLESLLTERLEEVEPGLTLVQRQYVTPVGRIDLLCRDHRGNYVVIELKRFRASTESIIDQVTRYMGWVQQHLTGSGEAVRGYIVVGKLDTKLEYSVRAIGNLKVKCFRVSLSDPD